MTKLPRRRGMSDRQVAALRKKAKRYIVPDPELRGHYVRVMPKAANVFAAVARDPYGKQVWATLGSADVLSIDEARDQARKAIKRIKAGLPPFEAPPAKPDTFRAVAENWLKRHVEKNGLRSRDEIERCLRKYVIPHWGEREFTSIRRSDVTGLLDYVEDHHGSRQADVVLSLVRAVANWHATRHDDYVVPFVRGMGRVKPGAGRRDRTLDDDEIRALWQATETAGVFGAMVRVLLLSSQRLHKVATVRWADIDADGVWTIATQAREKSNAGSLQLPKLALHIINAQPKFASNPYVFAGRGDSYFRDWIGAKRALEAKLPPMSQWQLHDLRRTARSLMSRAGVSPHVSERTLGHVIKGVEGIYDQHSYAAEKADALQRLANLIEKIVSGEPDNVVPLRAPAAQP